MKQKFKNKTLYTKTTVDNMLKVYDNTSDKTDWYEEANDFAYGIVHQFLNIKEISVAKVCGIIAALSPLKSWEENKKITITFLRDGKGKHTKMFTDKAQAILDSDGNINTIAEILNGNKITSFFLNIFNPKTSPSVTVDRHAVSIALGKSVTGDSLQMSNNQYNFFQNCYRIAAEMRGVRPLKMQSVTWVQWRKDKQIEQRNDSSVISTDFSEVPF